MPGQETLSVNNSFLFVSFRWLMIFSDFLKASSIREGGAQLRVNVALLWAALIEGLSPIWPATRTMLGDASLGDVWPCSALKTFSRVEGHDLVPFHKLTGWITYSLIEPMEKILGWKFEGVEDMTGLPEYRNGSSLFYFWVTISDHS
jgi:hypothetical protein